MTTISRQRVSRRKFLVNTTALSTASFLGLRHSGAAEPPPETTKVRLSPAPVLCTVSMLLADGPKTRTDKENRKRDHETGGRRH